MSDRKAKPQFIIYADGAVSAERAGAGIVVTVGRGGVLLIANRVLPPMTSTEAEYAGLILALETAAQHAVAHLELRLDSEVVIYQMAGRYAVNSPRLKPLHGQACVLARGIARVDYRHVPREHNVLADALASDAAAGRAWVSVLE